MYNEDRGCACANILLVGVCPDCVEIVIQVFKDIGMQNRLHTVSNELEASKYLCREEPYQNAPVPNLLILDVLSPANYDALKLEDLRVAANLRQIPVVCLVDSENERRFATQHNFEICLSKPFSFDKLSQILKSINTLSLSIIRVDRDKQPRRLVAETSRWDRAIEAS